MNVLYHLSHCSGVKADGWSGAPGEAQWVRQLVASIARQASPFGIVVNTVDGDLEDHPAFHADYDAFVAPHYEADVHGVDGAFWGRAAVSATASKDDLLGGLVWSEVRMLQGYKPPERFDWNNVNVTDYYGFRLTSAKTPGVLVEHAVGNRHPQGYDYVRQNVDALAGMHVSALCIMGGITKPMPPPPVAHTIEDVYTKVDALAKDTLLWLARLQRGLDVERGAPFDPHLPPIDTRVMAVHNAHPQAHAVALRTLTPEQKSHDGHGGPK